MARNGKKSGGRDFKPGQSGNPGGTSKVDRELMVIRKLSKEKFKELANILISGTREDLERMLASPGTSALTEMVIKVVLGIAERGDMTSLDRLLDRLIGKVKDEVDVTVVKPMIIERRNGTEVVLGVAQVKRDDE